MTTLSYALLAAGFAMLYAATNAFAYFATVIVTIAVATVLAYFVIRGCCIRCGKAARHDNVQCVTLANHKGGVGKTTIALLLAKQLANDDEAPNVLVVDCSIYGDISRQLLSDEGARVTDRDSNHLEGFAARVIKATLFGRLCKGRPRIDQFARKASGAENLFVLTSKAQSVNSISGTEECMQGNRAPVVARELRGMLSRDAAKTGKPWVIVVDTDGGLTHGMTRLALCLADTVTVPVNADVADIKRLRILLNLMEELFRQGLCIAEVTNAFFNRVPVQNNEPTAEAAALGLNFSVHDANMRQIRAVEDEFQCLRQQFPRLLSELAPRDRNKQSEANSKFFSSVRPGGTSLEKIKDNVSIAYGNSGFANDVDQLAQSVQRRLARKTLKY